MRNQIAESIVDRLLAVVGLIVTSPIFLVVAIILTIQREYVFFLQDRIGLDQKTFKIFRFTTMVRGSEKHGTITAADVRSILSNRV